MRWVKTKNKMPGKIEDLSGSDKCYLVLLHGKIHAVSYYYKDSLGHHWSSQFNIWDNIWDDIVTHWMKLPKI